MNQLLLDKLKEVERIASISKFNRMLNHPIRYFKALIFRELLYKMTGKELHTEAILFFGKKMRIALPAGTDIYLTGGKSHESEIRLARFMIRRLKEGDVVIDVGSHFGYFALLAKELVGGPGKVFAIEPTNNSFGILDQNVKEHTNLFAFQIALSDLNGYIDFFEFSNLYSEYSSVDIDQFKSSEWFNESVVQKRKIEARLLDDFLADHQLNPGFIKIDVEGSENKVIAGGMNYFKHGSPLVSMEYLDQSRQNHSHKEAVEILRQLGYSTFIINNGGECEAVSDIDSYLSNRGLDSDNIILMKT